MFVGSLLYLCAVVAFVFALIASLETNGLFLSEMFATWLASALIAWRWRWPALAPHGSALSSRPAKASPQQHHAPERLSSTWAHVHRLR